MPERIHRESAAIPAAAAVRTATMFDPTAEYSGGHGLFDEASCAAAEIIRKAMEDHKRKG